MKGYSFPLCNKHEYCMAELANYRINYSALVCGRKYQNSQKCMEFWGLDVLYASILNTLFLKNYMNVIIMSETVNNLYFLSYSISGC